MNDNNSMEGRVLLTVVVIIGIWIGWRYIFPAPEPQQPQRTAQKQKPDTTGQMDPDSGAPTIPNQQVAPKQNTTASQTAHQKKDVASSTTHADGSSQALTRPEEFYALETQEIKTKLSSKGYLESYTLKTYHARVSKGDKEKQKSKTKEKLPYSFTPKELDGLQQLKLMFSDAHLTPNYYKEVHRGDNSITLAATNDSLEIKQHLEYKGDYIWDLSYTIKNKTENTLPLKPSIGFHAAIPKSSGSFLAPNTDEVIMKCLVNNSVEDESARGFEEPQSYAGAVRWAAIDRQYFIAAIGPKNLESSGAANAQCKYTPQKEHVSVSYQLTQTSVVANSSETIELRLFMGPKLTESLQKADMQLIEALDYTVLGIPLAFLTKPMLLVLNIFYGWTKSYGLAIIMLTFLIKLLLFPISHKGMKSMREMQQLKPKMDDLKKRYPNDKEAQTREMMKMYQDNNVNPLMGGCFTTLLQMPIYFALYRTLWSAVELYQHSFLWVPDLTAKEPFPFIALSLGLVTFLQQKLSPTAVDNQQAKMMMYFMPIMMTVIMIALPSGLVLYIFANTVLTILHQLYINKRNPQPSSNS